LDRGDIAVLESWGWYEDDMMMMCSLFCVDGEESEVLCTRNCMRICSTKSLGVLTRHNGRYGPKMDATESAK